MKYYLKFLNCRKLSKSMPVYLYDLINGNNFSGLKIGEKIDFSKFSSNQYENIGVQSENSTAYRFDYANLVFEVTTMNNRILSFDILMKYQKAIICLGDRNQLIFNLDSFKLDDLLRYLNTQRLKWEFKSLFVDSIGNTIIVEVQMKYKLSMYFDFDRDIDMQHSLSLIQIS